MINPQNLQEELYNFPYHYLPSFKDNFQITILWKWGLQYVATIKHLIEELKKIKFNSLLDIGCGDGRIVKELHDYFPDKNISGIDISEKAIRLARALNPELNFEAIDIINTDRTKKHNVVTLIEVIEHIPPDQLDLFIEKTSNFLLEDGFLLLIAPSKSKILSKKHFQHFSKAHLCKLLSPHFDIVRVNYLHNPNRIFKVMMKILYNKWYLLNYQPLLDFIFHYYYKNVFIDKAGRGHRLYVLARKKRKETP